MIHADSILIDIVLVASFLISTSPAGTNRLERNGAAGRHPDFPSAGNEILSYLQTHAEPHLVALESRHYAAPVVTTRVCLKSSILFCSSATLLSATLFFRIAIDSWVRYYSDLDGSLPYYASVAVNPLMKFDYL